VRKIFRALVPAVLLAMSLPADVRADACIMDMWNNGDVQPLIIFPNYYRVKVASFDVWVCDGCTWVGTENLKGLTVVNFGTALASDFTNVYWEGHCGGAAPNMANLQTMTFAGNFTNDAGTAPAWTWAGTSINYYGCPDLCGTPVCGVYFTIDIYATIAPCPSQFKTISMGVPAYSGSGNLYPGGMQDNAGCGGPWFNSPGPPHNLVWAYKEGPDVAAPGDTCSYTIYYGKPGSVALGNIEIFDTVPQYMHYADGTANPVPDSGWDPSWGPPVTLKWTTGPYGVPGGGPTNRVIFGLSVDWGNGESFEPGSGDVGAPEKARLDNRAAVYWPGATTCGALKSTITPPVTTVARRFLFWKIGDNDMLFAPNYGSPPDEMIYSIFIKNMSGTKTWWDVRIWDTVPIKIDPWCANCGMEDPCVGWTMTPSGCVYAGGGNYVAAGRTIMTWKLDMPPGMTLNLRWKGQVVPNASSGDTAINTMSIREYGRTNIVGGTGNSGRTVNFTHLAPIMLNTTYVSYVGFAGADMTASCIAPGYFLSFNPMNKKSQFELRALWYNGAAGWGLTGGISASIGTLIGDCVGGFPGGGGIVGGGQSGCKLERIPAQYIPSGTGTCPFALPQHHIYKLTSNSPVLWQLQTTPQTNGSDYATYAPASTLNYTGLMHYMYRPAMTGDLTVGGNSGLSLISTAKDAYGVVDSTLPTTVHMFLFNYSTLEWDYKRSYELAGESQAYDFMATGESEEGAWRTVSSDTQLIIHQGFFAISSLTICCAWGGDNWGGFFPTRETGNCVSNVGSGTFYGLVQGTDIAGAKGALPTDAKIHRVVIGNTGAADAKYEIWRYEPDNFLVTPPQARLLNGTGGTWIQKAVDTVPAGLNAAGNPRWYNDYGPAFDSDSTGLFKIVVKSGGPIQVLGGVQVYMPHAGGSVMHAADGGQTGTEFWLHVVSGDWPGHGVDCGRTNGYQDIETVDVFCPKKGMVINQTSSGGLTVSYTTTGPDQCVSFVNIPLEGWATRTNYKFTVQPGPNQTDAITQYILCKYDQKGWTAPFLQTGVHYTIIMPPVVFVGVNFWMTVVVNDVGGNTKNDYLGTTSFTSTDPGAKLLGAGMQATDYVWVVGDQGVKVFINVSFSKLGLQTIIAMDTLDGSITGVGSTMVVGADVKLEKRKKLTVAASGDTVQFWICWSNYSSATAYSFTITDAVPNGTTYVPELASNAICGQNGPFDASVSVAASNSTTTTAPNTAFVYVAPATSPAATTRWLRWTVRDVYVNSTGCVCFKVIVN
jgi:uncharacterized repeat protein (TIGR01451 family)